MGSSDILKCVLTFDIDFKEFIIYKCASLHKSTQFVSISEFKVNIATDLKSKTFGQTYFLDNFFRVGESVIAARLGVAGLLVDFFEALRYGRKLTENLDAQVFVLLILREKS